MERDRLVPTDSRTTERRGRGKKVKNGLER